MLYVLKKFKEALEIPDDFETSFLCLLNFYQSCLNDGPYDSSSTVQKVSIKMTRLEKLSLRVDINVTLKFEGV